MKSGENQQNNNLININNNNQKNYITNNNKDNYNVSNKIYNNIKPSKTKRNSNISESSQEKKRKTFLNEFGIIEKTEIKTFDYKDFMEIQSCTTYYYGEEPIEQKAFICSVCDNKKKNYICSHCYKMCHQKCRNTLMEISKTLLKEEFKNIHKFSCYCGSSLKHNFDVKNKKELVACTMMELDNMLGLFPYHCYNHNITVCCICKFICHKECLVKQEQM